MRAIFDFNDYAREQFIREMARAVPPGARVLDAGAGTCRHKPLFAHCTYKAQDFAKYAGNDMVYGELDYISDITAIPAPDGAFDFILCTEVFEHIPRPDLAVAEFSRLLSPGGKLVITAPLGSAIHMAPYHFYGGFSPYWYQHFFAAAGLNIEFIRPNGGFFKLYGQESRRFLGVLTPQGRLKKALFFPIKAVLAIWFRLLVPVLCHFLDRFDSEQAMTVGYFVRASKQ